MSVGLISIVGLGVRGGLGVFVQVAEGVGVFVDVGAVVMTGVRVAVAVGVSVGAVVPEGVAVSVTASVADGRGVLVGITVCVGDEVGSGLGTETLPRNAIGRKSPPPTAMLGAAQPETTAASTSRNATARCIVPPGLWQAASNTCP
jgi:hypothetical protein